jgi:uncharacterized protein (DUF4415 family)
MARSDTQGFSLAELRQKKDAGQTETKPDAPSYEVPKNFWIGAQVITPGTPGKTHISMRIDTDVLNWYRQQGGGYLTRMNSVLRSFMEQTGNRPVMKPERTVVTRGAGQTSRSDDGKVIKPSPKPTKRAVVTVSKHR